MTAARRSDSFEREHRRQLVRQLRLLGHDLVEIAAQVQISVKTVRRDLEHGRRHPTSRAQQVELLADMVARFDILEHAAWLAHDAATSATDRLKTLHVIRKIINDRIRFAADCGHLASPR